MGSMRGKTCKLLRYVIRSGLNFQVTVYARGVVLALNGLIRSAPDDGLESLGQLGLHLGWKGRAW